MADEDYTPPTADTKYVYVVCSHDLNSDVIDPYFDIFASKESIQRQFPDWLIHWEEPRTSFQIVGRVDPDIWIMRRVLQD